MWLRWFPWKQLVSRAARSRGLVDPVKLLARLESFAQPLEMKEPLEFLRAGMVFHARGLLNTGAIQHNLDWIWPFWVERQYDPRDEAFIPRAFSLTHVNLTHRNWTAVGIPDFDELPIVDPEGAAHSVLGRLVRGRLAGGRGRAPSHPVADGFRRTTPGPERRRRRRDPLHSRRMGDLFPRGGRGEGRNRLLPDDGRRPERPGYLVGGRLATLQPGGGQLHPGHPHGAGRLLPEGRSPPGGAVRRAARSTCEWTRGPWAPWQPVTLC